MKSPKGFGKKYFTFASILAHSVETTIQSQVVRIDNLLRFSSKESDLLDEENDPPEDCLLLQSIQTIQPCHCDCLFNLKTKISLKINLFIPRCPFYTTYFAFRRTGVHPPLLSLTNQFTKLYK